MNSDDPDAETTSALSEIFGPDRYRNLIITEIHACGDTHTHTDCEACSSSPLLSLVITFM